MTRLPKLPGLVLLLVCVQVAAAADSIGFAYVEGSYRVNGARVRGNATLFEGVSVEIGEAPGKLQLSNGTSVWLTAGSRASVFSHGVVLLKGLGQYEGPSGSGLEARAIRVVAAAPETVVRVMLDEADGAVVMPIKGAVNVMNARGVRVGNLGPGNAVRFAEQPRAGAEVHVSGCVYREDQGFSLTDRVTHVPIRLAGSTLDREAGRVVAVSGIQLGANGEVRVNAVERLDADICDVETPVRHSLDLPAVAGAERSAEGAPQAVPTRLNLVVIEGTGAINNIRQRTAREPIVEVQDENHRPVAGALVLFALPKSGPGGTFANGATTLRVTTDSQGRAVARGLQPNRQTGQFQISVTASYGGLSAATTILETNLLEGAAAAAGGGAAAKGAAIGMGIGTKVAIISGVAATAVVGGLAASGVIFGGGGTQPAASR